MNYRDTARDLIKKAKSALNQNDEHYLKYAALDLRMALECFVYERAGLYKEELSNKSLSTWQPGRLLNILLEIDPYTDQNSTIYFGKEDEPGVPAKNMRYLGDERVLSLSEIKKYYDRLGSYLHTRTIEQVEKGKGATPDKIRSRCLELLKILEKVAHSSLFNINFRTTSKMECSNCGKLIVRRILPENKELVANCLECKASYKLTVKEDNIIEWKPIGENIPCANQSCGNKFFLFENEISFGTHWTCKECDKKNVIKLALFLEDEER